MNEKWKKIAYDLFGQPIGRGRHRIVFKINQNLVVKIPLSRSGEKACWDELQIHHERFAKTWPCKGLARKLGVSVVVLMERVDTDPKCLLPKWADAIDCRQVGLTLDGRFVAYDWEHR